jgi:hypothetical protein
VFSLDIDPKLGIQKTGGGDDDVLIEAHHVPAKQAGMPS